MAAGENAPGFLHGMAMTVLASTVLACVSGAPLSAWGTEHVSITQADPLPIVLRADAGPDQQLLLLELKADPSSTKPLRCVVAMGGRQYVEALTAPAAGGGVLATMVRIPYRPGRGQATLRLQAGEEVLAERQLVLEDVPEFHFYLFPSAHMCVAYENTMFLAHHDADYAVAQAVHMLDKYPEATWTVEYAWGLKLYWDKHPEQRDLVRRLVREGRLEVGGRFAPNIQDGLDGESLARQIAETQWWLERTFGVRARAAFDWDNMVYYPQESQLYRQGGLIGWVAGAYMDFSDYPGRPSTSRREGSPFFKHVGEDGSQVVVLAPARGLHGHYCTNDVVEFYSNRTGRGLLRTLNPQGITAEYGHKLAELVRKTQKLSGMDFLAGSADCGDQSGPSEDLYVKARIWNATFANPKIEFLSAAECLRKGESTGRVVDRVEGDIPWWIRQVGNMLVLRFRANEVAADLRFAETMASLDSLTLGAMYPADALSLAWEELLQVEQHEQLSSAVCNGDDVLDWSNARLDRAQAVARSAAHEAMRDIASRIAAKLPGRPVVVFNRLNWETHDVVAVKLPEGETNFRILDDAGREVPSAMKSAAEPEGIAFAASAPGLGYRTYYLASGGAVKTTRPQKKSNARIGLSIENEFYRLKVAPRTGLVVSLFDKTLRQELIDPARPAGGFRLVEDKGKDWHESHPTGKVWRQADYSNSTVTIELTPLGQELVARGPLLGEGEANFGKFREVRYRLAAGIPRLDIAIRYSWDADKSRRAWLMFDLPLALSKVKATYGTPYGAWDYREFAGSQPTLQRIRTMHNWCDLYEPDAGVGVTVAGPSTQLELNDDGLAIALTSRHGDTSGDLCIGLDGEHSFHYAMRSHRGDWRESQAVRFGAEHEAGRSPMGAVLATPRGGSLPATQTLLHVNGEHLVVTALKQAHEGEDIVLRLYEADGKPDVLSLPEVSRQGIAAAWESNIVEDRVAPLTPAALEQVHVAPWEIISLRLGLVSRGGEEKDWKQ